MQQRKQKCSIIILDCERADCTLAEAVSIHLSIFEMFFGNLNVSESV